MDTFKLILLPFLLFQSGLCFSALFDMSEHSGIIKGSDGSYSQVSANGSIRSLTSNTELALVEKIPFNTSKGLFNAEITRNALVDVSRIGATVRTVAAASGPVGLTLTAVSLVCELTSICKDLAGNWSISENSSLPDYPATLPTQTYYYVAGINSAEYRYPSPETGCSRAAAVDKFWGDGYTGSGSGTGATACTRTKTSDGSTMQTSITLGSGACPANYTVSGTGCALNGATPQTPTSSQWDAKQPLLNDSRFTPELVTKGLPVPVQVPTMTPISSPIDKRTTTLKDGGGNTTGTEDEITEAKLESPTPAENPTGNPNLIKITEITVKNTYNTSNILTNTTTTETGGTQQPQPQSFEIDIDNMQDQPLEEKAIPGIFSHTSWGSGSCPGDRSVSYHYGTLNLTFQPACDAAIALQPLVVILAGIAALFIISGAVRND